MAEAQDLEAAWREYQGELAHQKAIRDADPMKACQCPSCQFWATAMDAIRWQLERMFNSVRELQHHQVSFGEC